MKLIRIRVLKITEVPLRHFWYSNLVGQYVPLEGLEYGFWRSREPDGLMNFIAEDHARPVWALVKPEHLQRYPYVHSKEAKAYLAQQASQPANGQSRRHSAYEAATSVGIGFAVSVAITAVLLPGMGHTVTLTENLLMTSVFTVASVARSYALRRLFNRWAA